MGDETEGEPPNPDPNANGGVGLSGRRDESQAAEKVVVVVMGATGSGKSRLAVDLAARFPGVEIINADSMQVYRGLDVLTNKLPFPHRKGVPHHLLGTVDPSAEFTARDFRDLANPIIDDILSRGGLPVIVGGTNYYIQALVSPYLVDDVVEDMEGCSLNASHDPGSIDTSDSFERLKEVDPVAANRIHPNNQRKITHYLNLYESSGLLPSNLFQEKSAEKWGRADNFRYSCCFIWVDASLSVLDGYVNQRVDCMIDSGLLNEVLSIYNPTADYTRGLRQAIGVREFEDFFQSYILNLETCFPCLEKNDGNCNTEAGTVNDTRKIDEVLITKFPGAFDSIDDKLSIVLDKAIDKFKTNTRRLVRRQRRRLNRLKEFFGWHLHYIDATETFLYNCEESWQAKVVEPCAEVVNAFLCEQAGSLTGSKALSVSDVKSPASRDLWAQYVCEACGNQILRGSHEWEQHKQGRAHRKRALKLKKKNASCLLHQACNTTARNTSSHGGSNGLQPIDQSM